MSVALSILLVISQHGFPTENIAHFSTLLGVSLPSLHFEIMLLLRSLLVWSVALPAVLGVLIETNVLNTTSLICATRYASTSLDGAIPTVTFEGYLNHGPVMFHTTTTPVETVTPKPVITKTTMLVTNTIWITTTPISGVWNSTSTVLATSTCMSLEPHIQPFSILNDYSLASRI